MADNNHTDLSDDVSDEASPDDRTMANCLAKSEGLAKEEGA